MVEIRGVKIRKSDRKALERDGIDTDSDFDSDEDFGGMMIPSGVGVEDGGETPVPIDTGSKEAIREGKAFYGEGFTKYDGMNEASHLIPMFKDYFMMKCRDGKGDADIKTAILEFNARLPFGVTFFVPLSTLASFGTKWVEEYAYWELVPKKTPVKEILDNGVKFLAEDLIKDARTTLREATAPGVYMDPKERLEMKKYVVGVVSSVGNMINVEKKIDLAKKEDSRDEASFMMDLLGKVRAGTISSEELTKLKEAENDK